MCTIQTYKYSWGPKLVEHKVEAESSRRAPIGRRRQKRRVIVVIVQSVRSVNLGPNFLSHEFRDHGLPIFLFKIQSKIVTRPSFCALEQRPGNAVGSCFQTITASYVQRFDVFSENGMRSAPKKSNNSNVRNLSAINYIQVLVRQPNCRPVYPIASSLAIFMFFLVLKQNMHIFCFLL